jgi:hypothetical protein
VGELEHACGRDFVALRAQGPVLVISTPIGRDALYARLALSADDPDAAAAWLREVAAKCGPWQVESGLVNFPAALYIRGRSEGRGNNVKEG